MRQVFSSPRLENVERVAELLRAEAIEWQATRGGRSGRPDDRSTAAGRRDDRSGRLVGPDGGVDHTTHQEVASDAGIDAGAASAEEAAVHTLPSDQLP